MVKNRRTRLFIHLSTALDAEHRNKTIQEVKKRLKDKNDTDWTLVATSCVEAGLDFSFRTGFRELASLVSLLQIAGRINRDGMYDDAIIWTFMMQEDTMLTKNKGIKDAAYVLKNHFFEKGISISPELGTESLKFELCRQTVCEDAQSILYAETYRDFPMVQKKFRVIEEDTVLVVADPALKKQLCQGGCDWKAIQRKAVSIQKYRVRQLHLQPLTDGVYDWNLGYDEFIGIMRGLLPEKQNYKIQS